MVKKMLQMIRLMAETMTTKKSELSAMNLIQ
jgi:hypothetical protein